MAQAHHRLRVPGWAPTLVAVFAIGLALLAGWVSAMLPPWWIVAMLMVPALALLMLMRPEYGLTACVALVCGLIHPAFVPRLPVFGGALAAADATLAMLFVYAAWSLLTQRTPTVAKLPAGVRWLGLSLALFGLCFAVAVVLSLTARDIGISAVLGETRDLLYMAMLPIAVVILRQPKRLRRFVVSFVVLGCLFSVGQVLQGIFTIPVFGAEGISSLETLGQQHDGTTRANTLGLNVIVFSLLITLGAYVLGVIRSARFLAVGGLLLLGIALTFGRTTYAAVLVCGVLVIWWLDARKLPAMLGLLVLVVAGGSAIGLWLKPDSVAAVYFRMTSIGEEIDRGYSAQWRFWEAEAMWPHIAEKPLVGIGLGADYKGARGSTQHPELNRYVHNGYLYMAGKMGLPALATFLSMMAAIGVMGHRMARSTVSPAARVVGAACAAMMVRFVAASITEPHLMEDYGVVNIAVAGALVVLFAHGASTAAAALPAREPGRVLPRRTPARVRNPAV